MLSPGRISYPTILSVGWRYSVFFSALVVALLIGGRDSFAEVTNELAQLQARCLQLSARQFKLAEARPVVYKRLALTLGQGGEVHLDTVVALHWVAFLAQQAGRYAEAEKTWLKSLAIQEKLPRLDLEWFTRTLHMLAGVARDQFDFVRA